MKDLEEGGFYHDLVRKLCNEGHRVFAVYPIERRFNAKSTTTESDNFNSFGVKTLNIQKPNYIEKTNSTVLLSHKFKKAIFEH